MPKLAPQTKSFIILFVIAIVGSYVCLMLWWLVGTGPSGGVNYTTIQYPTTAVQTPAPVQLVKLPAPQLLDTTSWKTYSNPKLGISFLYAPSWKILPAAKQNGFTVLQIDPGKKYYNFKIYINPSQYYVMAGLPLTPETISGQPAMNFENCLYGIQANGTYYTFDIGMSMSQEPGFDTLVHTVKFE